MRLGLVLALCVFLFNAPPAHAVDALDLKVSFSDAVKRTSPAVVNIFTEKVVTSRGGSIFARDPFFQHFFGDGGMATPTRKRLEQSLGSGVVVTENGYMITNYHVIKDSKSIKVVFNDRREYPAEYVTADPAMDVAILKIQGDANEKFDHAVFGDSDKLEVGDVVLAIGNPYGVGQSVSMGIVSALGRSNVSSSNAYQDFIQTDAAINPGNSGGALVDSHGDLIGINTAIFTKSGGSQGISFAIPANTIWATLKSVLQTGEIERPWFGATGQDMTPELAEQLELRRPTGVLFNEVVEGGPADKAGMKVGDIILEFNGHDVATTYALNARMASTEIGNRVPMTIWRGGRELALYVTLEKLPARKEEDRFTLQNTSPLRGFTFERLTPTLNHELGLALGEQGVAVVGVPPSNNSFTGLNLRPGDVIVDINEIEIKTLEDVKRATAQRPRAWKIIYKRGSSTFKVYVQ